MATYYWVGGSGTWNNSSTANWSLLSGGVAGVGPPLAADTALFDANSGTAAIVSMASTAACAVMTVNKSDLTVSLTANASGGTVTLTAGTIKLNNFTLSSLTFISSNSNVRTIDFGTGKINITPAFGGTLFNTINTTNLAIVGTPTIDISGGGSAARTFFMGALSEASAWNVNVTAGTFALTFGANNTFKNMNFTGFSGSLANIAITIYGSLTASTGMTFTAGANAMSFRATSGTVTHTFNGKTLDLPVTFNALGSTQVLNDALTVGATRTLTLTAGTIKFKSGATSSAGTFSIVGSPSVSLNATTDGSAATISQSTGTVDATNATIKDITATGGATWNAFATNGNVNDGGNTGWDFYTQAGKYMYNVRKSKRILI
jgi:hypothetical protein